jgi:hypothetical protein
VWRVRRAPPGCGRCRLHQPTDGPSGLLVIHADVRQPTGVRIGVVVHREERHFGGDPRQVFLLSLRVDDADGDPLHPLLKERLDDGHLLGDIHPFGLAEQDLHVEILPGLLRAGLA